MATPQPSARPYIIDRRRFIALTTMSIASIATGCSRTPGAGRAGRGNTTGRTWTNELKIPPADNGKVGPDGIRRFTLTAAQHHSDFLPGRKTPTWGFNGAYLGPTLRARSTERVQVTVRNDLSESTTVHWHGMRLPAVADGTPHQIIEPGSIWEPTWTIEQPAATLWYHPHPHGHTAAHVYRGLAGLWIVDDENSNGLPSDYGIDDIPLVIQDRNFDDDGSLREDQRIAIWGLMGNDILINGTYDPHLRVTTRRVRFRVLNGSNARMYNLRFSDDRRFHVVGGDCALLPKPVEVNEVSLSPAERIELLVEFNPNDTIELVSRSGNNGIDEGNLKLLQISTANQLTDNAPMPTSLPAPDPIEAPTNATRRTFVLSGDSKINSKSMDMSRIDEVVPAGATEIWTIDNLVFPHNFHIHGAAFTIVDIDGQPPPAHMSGPKDTVFIGNHQTVNVAVEFANHTNLVVPYMYHCHILQHEDKGMMGQFTVVAPGTEDTAPRQIDADHSGHHPT